MRRKKHLRNSSALVLAAILALAVALPAAANDALPDPAQLGSITIHKYAIDDPLDFDVPATGEALDPNTDPINGNGDTLSDLFPLEGVSFTVTRVDPASAVVGPPATGTPTAPPDDYSQTLPTNASGVAQFSLLAHGLYLVTENSNPTIETPVQPFLVRVPMTNPTGDGWIYDVHVYPKNVLTGSPNIALYVTEMGNYYDSVQLLQNVTWIGEVEIPADVALAQEFLPQANFDSRLALVANSGVLYANYSGSANTPLLLTTDYTISTADPEFEASVIFTPAGLAKLQAVYDAAALATEIPHFYIEYDTTLTIPPASLYASLAVPIGCDVELTYRNSVGQPHGEQAGILHDGEPYIYTGGLVIQKTNRADSAPLADAIFEIYTSLADAQAGTNPVLTPGGATAWQSTTDADGLGFFSGLAYGSLGVPLPPDATPSSSYWLVEIMAPEGFDLLDAPIEVTVDSASHLMAGALPVNPVAVENGALFALPITGGAGTVLFTIVGLVLIGAGLLLLYSIKKSRSKQRKKY